MEINNETTFDEIQQEIVGNIATQAFIRGKIDGLYTLENYFSTFHAKHISKEDLIKTIHRAILVLQEGLK